MKLSINLVTSTRLNFFHWVNRVTKVYYLIAFNSIFRRVRNAFTQFVCKKHSISMLILLKTNHSIRFKKALNSFIKNITQLAWKKHSIRLQKTQLNSLYRSIQFNSIIVTNQNLFTKSLSSSSKVYCLITLIWLSWEFQFNSYINSISSTKYDLFKKLIKFNLSSRWSTHLASIESIQSRSRYVSNAFKSLLYKAQFNHCERSRSLFKEFIELIEKSSIV